MFVLISCEGGLVLNNLFLMVVMVVVLVGMFYFLVLDVIIGEMILVGELFFNLIFGFLMVLLLLVVLFGLILLWKRGDFLVVL